MASTSTSKAKLHSKIDNCKGELAQGIQMTSKGGGQQKELKEEMILHPCPHRCTTHNKVHRIMVCHCASLHAIGVIVLLWMALCAILFMRHHCVPLCIVACNCVHCNIVSLCD